MKRFLAFLCLFILNISLSHAAVTINVVESGGNVVATVDGTLDLTGSSTELLGSYGVAFVRANAGYSQLKAGGHATQDQAYFLDPTTTLFTSLTDGVVRRADSSSGDPVYIEPHSNTGSDLFAVSNNYVSSAPLAGTATWNGTTLAALGLTVGTYTYTVGGGVDSITLNIGVTASTYSLGGTITGLTGSVTLQNNGGDDLTKSADGSFTFATELAEGDNYAVTVSSHPTGQTCSVSNANNTMPATDVANISVVCTNNAFIDSAVLSVDASKFYFDVVITDTAGVISDELIFRIATEGLGIGGATDKQRIAINFDTISGAVTRADEVQTFGSPPHDRWTIGKIPDLSITASASDGWHIVGSVLHGTEPYVAGDIVSDVQFRLSTATGTRNLHMPDVVVTAVSAPPTTYSVGGTVSNLTGTGLQLQNGSETLDVAAAATAFTFTTELADSAAYAVTVSAQPTGQTCSVTGGDDSNGSGTVAGADVTSVVVTCVDDAPPPALTYSVGGNVSGLTGTGLQLNNNAVEDLSVAADGPFTFIAELADGDAYAVTVSTQPTSQTCSVTNGSGTIAGADVTNISVACADNPITPPVPAKPIPTLSNWALILLSMLLGMAAFARTRRQ